MSTMALIMFVLVLLAYVKNLISEKRLADFQQRIAASERQLKVVQNERRQSYENRPYGRAELIVPETLETCAGMSCFSLRFSTFRKTRRVFAS